MILVSLLPFHFFIKTMSLFIPVSALLDHFFKSVWHFKKLPPFIIRYSRIEIFGYVIQHIQTGHVCSTESCRFGVSGQSPGQKIDLFSSEFSIKKPWHDRSHRKDTNSIGNEVGSIPTDYCALTKNLFVKASHILCHGIVGAFGWDDLQKLHVARWIKKVGSQKMRFKLIRNVFTNF